MTEQNRPGNFEQGILSHLDPAYSLARWLTRNDQDAEEMVQEPYLRAFRFFGAFRSGDARAWLLACRACAAGFVNHWSMLRAKMS